MNCAELDIPLCEYVDGTLDAATRAAVERHLAGCPACAEVARESAAAVAFIGRAADVEPPAELVNRILFAAPWRQSIRAKHRTWLAKRLSPILQPRYVMSFAMTIVSFSLLRSVIPLRSIRPDDLRPSKVWAGLETRVEYGWGRVEKFYDNLKVVYRIQTTLRAWQQQDEEREPTAPRQAPAFHDERKLPVVSAPAAGEAPGGTAPAQVPESSH
ncbi:MAG: zf-HC2 domain-containing protein [Bryobacteraceae bacterium]